jgi:predicted alpha/beta superfamily hydrolase
VIVTDGDLALIPSLAPRWVAWADSLNLARKSRPLALVFSASGLYYADGSAWACSRDAIYTPNSTITSNVSACSPQWGQADRLLDFFATTALPLVRQTYGVGTAISTGKAGIAGFSLGGLTSCFAAWSRPDIFDAAACGSPSFWYPTTVCDRGASVSLDSNFFSSITMKQHPPPLGTALWISDGTTEALCMGGTADTPGTIPLTVQAMRSAGMTDIMFEQNEGFQHDAGAAWYGGTLWRSLSAIAPYVDPAPLTASPTPMPATVPVEMRFTVNYNVSPSCAGVAVDPVGNAFVPCGPGVSFFVVIAPCPTTIGYKGRCWDGAVHDSCPTRPEMPVARGCLPAANDGSNATFTTAGLPLTDPPDDAYLLATVYYETTSNPGAWKMQVDLATRVPLSAWSGAGASPVVLAPHFSPIASGSMQFAGSLPLALPGLPTVYMPTMVYLPPACTENAAACAAAKVVIVTDGDLALIPSLAPRWVAWADSLNLARKSRPLALVFSASGLFYADGSAWACSRDAIYTPSTVNTAESKNDPCAPVFGQAAHLVDFFATTALPLVRQTYGVGTAISTGKAGIAGFSLGGLTSCFAAWSRPDIFDAAACGSPVFGWGSPFWYPMEKCYSDAPVTLDSFFSSVTMRQHPPPLGTVLWISDGTAEAPCMGGTTAAPGVIPQTVAAMRSAGMTGIVFEQNAGMAHDTGTAWYGGTLWRSLSAIAPYVHPAPLVTVTPTPTTAPTDAPSKAPTDAPTATPTKAPTDAPSKAPAMPNPPSRAATSAGEDAAITLGVISLGFAGMYCRLRTARVRKEQQLRELSPFEQVGGL